MSFFQLELNRNSLTCRFIKRLYALTINSKNITATMIFFLWAILNLSVIIFNMDIIYAQVPGEAGNDLNLGDSVNVEGSKTSDVVSDDKGNRSVEKVGTGANTDRNLERTKDLDKSSADDKGKVQLEEKDNKTERGDVDEKKSALAKKAEKKKSSRKKRLNDGLLEIIEGDFKYKRIPGLVEKETAPRQMAEEVEEGNIDEMAVPSSSLPPSSDASDVVEEGVFGLSKDTTDIALKIVLFLMIAVIFLIFRFKSKNRSRNSVLKRFPK